MAAGVLGGGPVMTAMIWTQGQSSGRGDFLVALLQLRIVGF